MVRLLDHVVMSWCTDVEQAGMGDVVLCSSGARAPTFRHQTRGWQTVQARAY
jgi:hypothetical protein